MRIEKFNLIIDEKNCLLSLIVDINNYDLSELKNETIKYKVDNIENKIVFYNPELKEQNIEFRLNSEIIIYAYKSINIPIIVHKKESDEIIYIINTELE